MPVSIVVLIDAGPLANSRSYIKHRLATSCVPQAGVFRRVLAREILQFLGIWQEIYRGPSRSDRRFEPDFEKGSRSSAGLKKAGFLRPQEKLCYLCSGLQSFLVECMLDD